MNEAGIISDSVLGTYYENGTKLTAHPVSDSDLVEFGTGSLGHGISLAVGKCKARKLNGDKNPIFCLVSDGELNEGSSYEGINFAIKHQLDNLVIIVDNNGLQGLGESSKVLGDLTEIYFNRNGLYYSQIDGHDIDALKLEFEKERNSPGFINAKTLKGKGVSFIEGDNNWHYLTLDQSLYEKAIGELI